MKKFAIGVVCVVLASAIGWAAAPKKKRRPAAPRVTAAQRATAREEIARRMATAGAAFENPEALEPFYRALAGNPIHILQFGDSHTASDDWVNAMRAVFQAKFGDGGPGFVAAGRPFKGYRRFDAHATASLKWRTQGTMTQLGDTLQGLGGLSISTSFADQTIGLSASGELLSVFYLIQPGGGSLELAADGQSIGRFSTEGPAAAGIWNCTLAPGQHELTLRTLDRAPVRLYGWTLDNKTGATFETLGINGALAHIILGWNEAIWAPQLTARNPALIVLAYGTNEANSRRWTAEQYREEMKAVIARVRAAAPQAALLMIGPPDCGRLHPLPFLSEVIAAQHEIAREEKVAYFDLRKRMGGAGSVKLWVTAGYGQTDYIHMTGEGYKLVGETIANALLEGQNEQAGKDR